MFASSTVTGEPRRRPAEDMSGEDSAEPSCLNPIQPAIAADFPLKFFAVLPQVGDEP
jgi:hypothetical protein